MAKNYSVEGLRRRAKDLVRAIKAADSQAVAQNAKEWVAASRATAPQDPKDGTPLHDSIRHYETATGGQVVRAGGETTMKDSPAGPYDYALGQEFGTADMPANPFFWPVYRLLKRRFSSRRSRALNKVLKDFSDGE